MNLAQFSPYVYGHYEKEKSHIYVTRGIGTVGVPMRISSGGCVGPPVRYLIVSDIHANLEGLNAILAANEGLYDQILCCGDFVDYCASPNEVCDWARTHCEVVIRGNHDKACCGLDDTDDYNPLAQAAVQWTMGQLTPENLEWLRMLPQGPVWIEDKFQLVHGSPYSRR